MTKLCKNCKWFSLPGFLDGADAPVCETFVVCSNPRLDGIATESLVMGLMWRALCKDVRNNMGLNNIHLCGKEGRWFEPRDPE